MASEQVSTTIPAVEGVLVAETNTIVIPTPKADSLPVGDKSEHEAAVKVQSSWRGHRTRKELKAKEAPKTESTEEVKGKEPAVVVDKSEHEAAVKLQSSWRGYRSRNEIREQTAETAKPRPGVAGGLGVELSGLNSGGSDAKSALPKVSYLDAISGRKKYTGGYCDTMTGNLYFNSAAQTIFAHELRAPKEMFHRESQTIDTRNRVTQTTRVATTQTKRRGLYQSGQNDREIKILGTYETADQFHYRRKLAAIKIQAFFRTVMAVRKTSHLRDKKRARDEYARQKENSRRTVQNQLQKATEESALNPRTKSDFEALYTGVDNSLHRKNSVAAIKAEIEDIRQIISKRTVASKTQQSETLNDMLYRAGASKQWTDKKGQTLSLDTPEMRRARELNHLFDALQKEDVGNEERLKILLSLRYTVQEYKTGITQEIVYLITRESDWLARGRSVESLKGLRQRLVHLFLQFIRTPEFNPAITRHVDMVASNLVQCVSCVKFLPRNAFGKDKAGRKCNSCVLEFNKAVRRWNDKGLKMMLKWLIIEEELKETQLEGLFKEWSAVETERNILNLDIDQLRSLTERIWKSHSVISGDTLDAHQDISNLIFTRWNILGPLDPANCILLKKNEAVAHDRFQLGLLAKEAGSQSPSQLKDVLEDALFEKYKAPFVQRIRTAHLTATTLTKTPLEQ